MVHYDFIAVTRRILFATSLALAWIGPAHAENAKELASVRDQYDAATVLFTEKNYEGARKLLLEVWGQRKTADVATLLGQIEVKLGHHAEAAKYLAFASANFPPTEPVKRGEIIRGWLAEEKKRVVTCEVTSNVDGASVSVDGIEVGVTPLASPLFLEPGMHLIVLKKDGYKLADRSVNANAGATESWEAKLVPLETATVPSAPAAPPKSSVPPISRPPETLSSSKPNPWILVGGGVVTVGAFVTGLVFNGKADTAQERVQSLRAETGASGCYDGGSASASVCADLLDEGKRKDSARNISTGAFVVGGVAAVGTALYWFWPRRQAPVGQSGLSVNGSANSTSATIVVTGRF